MPFQRILTLIITILIVSLSISCNLTPEEEYETIVVSFPDPNFESLIREILDIPSGDITDKDLWTIKIVDGRDKNITDITGIEYCAGLFNLDLRNNNISE